MKIHSGNKSRGAIGMKVAGKKPKGWKEGDELPPRVMHRAVFDEHGNAEVDDDTGKVLMAAHARIKKGHNEVPTTPEGD